MNFEEFLLKFKIVHEFVPIFWSSFPLAFPARDDAKDPRGGCCRVAPTVIQRNLDCCGKRPLSLAMPHRSDNNNNNNKVRGALRHLTFN